AAGLPRIPIPTNVIVSSQTLDCNIKRAKSVRNKMMPPLLTRHPEREKCLVILPRVAIVEL
ncbi:MAG: hypothetical protein ACYDB0_09345, partial [Acidithiobacillus sp.]